MSLSKSELHSARQYNKKAAGRTWVHQDLPSGWRSMNPGSKAFALLTHGFQAHEGVKADGWLGPRTLHRILMTKSPWTTTKPEVRPPGPYSYGWINSHDQMIIHPEPGSRDGWVGKLSICDHHIWSKRDPDLKTDKVRTAEEMVAGVLHTTGYGAGVKNLDDKYGDDATTIDEKYAHRLAEILTYKGDFLVGRTGYLCMMSPLRFRTYHSTSSFQKEYQKKGWASLKKVKKGRKGRKTVRVNVSAWPDLWPGLESPLDLPGFGPFGKRGKRNINKHTWSIDLLAPKPGDTYTDEQYETVARLVYHVHVTYGIPLDRHHINGHSDINPLDRSNPGNGLWDPGPRWDWRRVFNRISEITA